MTSVRLAGRLTRRAVRLRASAGLIVALGLAPLALAGCGGASGHPAAAGSSSSEGTYGSLPTFLPSAAVRADSLLTGTPERPALTTEGDAVLVRLGATSVLATVTGPEVPGEGLPYQTPATTCTWTVTLSQASSPVPLVIADFSTIDHLGAVYHPALVQGAATPPATLQPGQSTTFELRTVMPTGEGLMRWAPDQHSIVASWDFEVEND